MDPRLPDFPLNRKQMMGYNFFQIFDHFFTRDATRALFGGLRSRNFKSIVKSFEQAGPGLIVPIDEREEISPSEFKKSYLQKGIPLVLKGAAKNWGCVKTWNLEYFRELHGTDEVPLIQENDPEKGIEYIQLKELIERINKGDKGSYFRFYNLLTRHPERYKDINQDWLQSYSLKKKYFESYQVFIGGAGSTTYVHNSHISNFFIQACGKKQWVLYPNKYVPFIDPPSTLNGIYRDAMKRGVNSFNAFNPNYSEYPYYKYLSGYAVNLEPGDILFNPSYMWHTVRNETDSIGIGYRWINASNSFKASPAYYLLDLLAFRPNYFKSLKMVRENANSQFEHRMRMMKKWKK